MNPPQRPAVAAALGRLLGHELCWVAAAFLIRAAFAWLLGERFYQADEGGYSAAARSVAGCGVFGVDGKPMAGAPMTGLVIGSFYWVGGTVRAARLGGAAVSTATAWLIGRMTAELTGSRRAGLFALALAAVYPFFVYYSGLLMSETVYLAFIVPGLWLLCGSLAERGGRPLRLAAAGLLLSCAGLTRVEAVPIALVLWAAAGALCALGRLRWGAWALAVCLWAAPLGLWMARNKALTGAFTMDTHGGMTLLHGTLLLDENEIDTGVAQAKFETLPLYEEGRHLDELSRDRLYSAAAWRYMREDPARTLRQWLRKFINFWRLFPRTDKVYPDTEKAKPGLGASRGLLVAASLAFEPALLGFGLWGAWLLRRRAWELFPLYWMVLATCGVHVIVVSQMRYRLAVMPVFILFACAAVDRAAHHRGSA